MDEAIQTVRQFTQHKFGCKALGTTQSMTGWGFIITDPGPCDCGRDAALTTLEQAVATLRAEKVLAAIPNTWLDPLLTGEKAVLRGSGPWANPDIERLMNAIRARVRTLLEEP